MEFKTMENRYRPKTPAGSEKLAIYAEQVNKEGRTYLKKIEETNIYEKIQASLNETQIYNVIERYLQTGDASLINKRKGVYANFVDVPKTEIDMLNIIMRAEHEFEGLDKDVRAEFDNDVGVFKQSIMDHTFETKMNKYIEKKNQKKQVQQPTQTQQTETNQGVNLNE